MKLIFPIISYGFNMGRILIGFFSTFVYQALFMYGMKFTAAGDASLMITFNPIFTALLAVPFLNEKMNWRLAMVT